MSKGDWLKLVVAVVGSELAGIIGSVFTVSSIPTWYATIVRPELSPPNWIFGPVWTTLYGLMGVAAFLVWSSYAEASEDKKKGIKIALALFGIQLVLNTLWSVIFFGLQNPGAALIEILVLWLAIITTIVTFSKISKPAAWLLVPYIAWVSFAAYLNYSIWALN